MIKLKVNEIFYSIQGEGARAGEMSIFIRLAGCNLTCGFCDTEFESGKEMTIDELAAYIGRWNSCNWIVWTGGEPALQLTEEIIREFHMRGYSQAVETNGSKRLPPGINWICCSPKVADHVLKASFPLGVDELRYVRHSGQLAVPEPPIASKYHYLSPMFDGNQVNIDNVRHCMKLCAENPVWRLSIQLHKLLQVL